MTNHDPNAPADDVVAAATAIVQRQKEKIERLRVEPADTSKARRKRRQIVQLETKRLLRYQRDQQKAIEERSAQVPMVSTRDKVAERDGA